MDDEIFLIVLEGIQGTPVKIVEIMNQMHNRMEANDLTLNRTTEDWHSSTQAATARVVRSLNLSARSCRANSDDNRYSP